MEGEKDNYRGSVVEFCGRQIEWVIMLVVEAMGVEKGQQSVAQPILSCHAVPSSSSLSPLIFQPPLAPSQTPYRPMQAFFPPHLISAKALQAPQYILEVIL